MGEIDRIIVWLPKTYRILKIGLIAYATLMLIPIFNHNAGIHQWDIQVINLIRWVKVSDYILAPQS